MTTSSLVIPEIEAILTPRTPEVAEKDSTLTYPLNIPPGSVDTYLSVLREIYNIPTVKSARIIRTTPSIITQLVTEHTDFEQDKRVCQETTYIETTSLGPAMPQDRNYALQAFVSPSGKRRIFFTSAEETWKVELFEENRCVGVYSAKGVHDSVPKDVPFQRVVWASDETKISYVAQVCVKTQYLWQPPADAKTSATTKILGKFTVQDNWGEASGDIRDTALFVCDFAAKKISMVQGLPTGYTYALPTRVTDTSYFIIGIHHGVRRLGLAHCPTRDSTLFTVDVTGGLDKPAAVVNLANPLVHNVRSLTISPDGTSVAFLGSVQSKAHNAAHNLYVAKINDFHATLRILATELYPMLRNKDIEWADQDHIIVNSVRQSSAVIYMIAVASGEKRVVSKSGLGAWTILDVSGHVVVAMHSTHIQPSMVYYTSDITSATPTWTLVASTATPSLTNALSVLTNRVETREQFHGSEIILSTAPNPRGTMVIVHGGPHACDCNSFFYAFLFYAFARYRIVSINYGGSSGFGQNRIEGLSGKIGIDDVGDVMECLRSLSPQEVDLGHVVVYGGSHGGFLSAQLSARYPDVFRAVSMRNPVINIASMYFETDIPDWCHYEVAPQVSAEDLEMLIQKMFQASPIAHQKGCVAPTLIALGSGDLRVPPAQGRVWYHALKSRGVDVRLVEYPGLGHALDGASCEADYILHTTLLFNKHI